MVSNENVLSVMANFGDQMCPRKFRSREGVSLSNNGRIQITEIIMQLRKN